METFKRTVSEDDLARLKRDREEADRRYNDALTALDQSIQPLPDFPHPPPAPDEAVVTPLNQRWEILKARPPAPGGWRGRVAAIVWRLVEPVMAQQQAFNALVVEHVNRSITPQRETAKSIESVIARLRQQVERLLYFQSRLIVYLQGITPYIDTKDYEFAGLGRRTSEDTRVELERLDELDEMTRGLIGALQGLSDEVLKRLESRLARDERYDLRIDQLRSGLAATQQQAVALKRAFERLTATEATIPRTATPTTETTKGLKGRGAPTHELEGWKYVGFENLYRGSREEISSRLEAYLPLFAGARDVVDVGCGRGEFLELLASRGVTARGIDINHEMIEGCRARGLDVTEVDALAYLRGLPDQSLGGLFAAQVVEHLEPGYLLAFLDQAQRVMRPGSTIALETINVACWLAFFESYIRDITHARALHPDTLKYLVTASGFVEAVVQFRGPISEADRLQRAPLFDSHVARTFRSAIDEAADPVTTLADTFNENVDRLNRLIFTHLDYAVVARRP